MNERHRYVFVVILHNYLLIMYISTYILTYNSSKYIDEILYQVSKFSDEIVVVDSGSTDGTLEILKKRDNVCLLNRNFDNFKNQRNFAASKCKYDWLFFVDSDEIPDNILVESLLEFKRQKFVPPEKVFSFSRKWVVMGRTIHSLYPVESPDNVVRLFNKSIVSFDENSNLVHETLGGYSQRETLAGTINHRTFETKAEIYRKIEQYTSIAARDMILRGRSISYTKMIFDPPAAFVKWFFFKKGFLDGKVGIILGKYAYRYTKEKYCKALELVNKKRV
mgnify:CR=1 FL=1